MAKMVPGSVNQSHVMVVESIRLTTVLSSFQRLSSELDAVTLTVEAVVMSSLEFGGHGSWSTAGSAPRPSPPAAYLRIALLAPLHCPWRAGPHAPHPAVIYVVLHSHGCHTPHTRAAMLHPRFIHLSFTVRLWL